MSERESNLAGREPTEQERAEEAIGPQVNFRPSKEDKLRLWRLMERTGLGISEVLRFSLAQTERHFPMTRPSGQIDRVRMQYLVGFIGILRCFCQAALHRMREQQVSIAEQRLWVQNLLASLHNPLHICSVLAEYLDLEQCEVFLHHNDRYYLQYQGTVKLLERQVSDISSRYPPKARRQARFEEENTQSEYPLQLFSEDILSAYQETLASAAEQRATLLETLRQGVLAFLPRTLTQAKGATA
ncbi:hypothetical protein [Ktedonobacter racemifer]|uniref:hypothetical protein n=1 Tax=Ktedonobacter racemifer TaxID=363277 RepID=UPI00058B2C62|nr:hypothetical protein [Ktedonobacter racemifer]